MRAIGQDLENLRLARFNLECTGSGYLVWRSGDADRATRTSRSLLSPARLRALWKHELGTRSQGEEEHVALTPLRRVTRYRYTQTHIEQMDQAGRLRRQFQNGRADGHSLSQLLRSAGALMQASSCKLLGIAWQETTVSIVFEDDSGRRGIDVFRPDQLYDFWVKMYLQRNSGPRPDPAL